MVVPSWLCIVIPTDDGAQQFQNMAFAISWHFFLVATLWGKPPVKLKTLPSREGGRLIGIQFIGNQTCYDRLFELLIACHLLFKQRGGIPRTNFSWSSGLLSQLLLRKLGLFLLLKKSPFPVLPDFSFP